MSEQDGGSAFPVFERQHVYRDEWDRSGEDQFVAVGGMSLRDYFAGQAIAACADAAMTERDAEITAARAYKLADAMLKARTQ